MRAQLDQLRQEFVQSHAGAFIHPRQALEFADERLAHLPSTDRAAFAKELIDETDRTVRWPPEGRRGLPPKQQREREERAAEMLRQYVADARAEKLGVDDLIKELALKRENVLQEIEFPAIAVHFNRSDEVVRDGSELVYTGWIPTDGGYTRVQARIDAEQSDGPLTAREISAIGQLRSAIAREKGELPIPDEYLGSIEGTLRRPFEVRRALANGVYVVAPKGEGKMTHSTNTVPASSSFNVGPATFHVMHRSPSYPFEHRLADGSSYRVHAETGTLQLQMKLGDDVVYATLTNQASPEARLADIIALTRAVFVGR